MKKKTVTRLDSQYMEQYDAYIERQRDRNQRLKRRLVLFSLVALLTIGMMASYHVKQRSVQKEKLEQLEQLEDQLASLEKEENNFIEEISLLNNEEYVLEFARTNYFFSKKGELIFKIDGINSSY